MTIEYVATSRLHDGNPLTSAEQALQYYAACFGHHRADLLATARSAYARYARSAGSVDAGAVVSEAILTLAGRAERLHAKGSPLKRTGPGLLFRQIGFSARDIASRLLREANRRAPLADEVERERRPELQDPVIDVAAEVAHRVDAGGAVARDGDEGGFESAVAAEIAVAAHEALEGLTERQQQLVMRAYHGDGVPMTQAERAALARARKPVVAAVQGALSKRGLLLPASWTRAEIVSRVLDLVADAGLLR